MFFWHPLSCVAIQVFLVGRKEYLNCLCVHNPKLHALNYFSNFILLEGFCFSEIVVWESLCQLKLKVGTNNCRLGRSFAQRYSCYL